MLSDSYMKITSYRDTEVEAKGVLNILLKGLASDDQTGHQLAY